MPTAKYFKVTGEAGDAWELPADPFDGIINEVVLHPVVKAHLANRRQGTASTKTRGKVRGGGRKIWRQKGTGRARQGSIRAPHWRGGGVVFGPTPRDYEQKIPKKVKALARRSALNSQAGREQISVIERFDVDAPKTRRMTELLEKIGIGKRRILILVAEANENLYLSTRNLQNVSVLRYDEASAYDLMNASELLIEEAALKAAKVASDA
jgi:large subunit ribosomal protein L4